FGEKDYQQLLIIKKLVSNLDIICKIVSIPTVRDKDGLALSSRNKYIDKKTKVIANNLYKILCEASKNIINGKKIDTVIYDSKNNILECGFTKIDYFEVRNEENLAKLRVLDTNKARILVAAYINEIRLIDNLIIE
ncbi:MAG: hypothetical protein CFH31_01288, partial [Alphaproteobacteria bacterium MarineAlpha9_Bin1]